ncbi:unnamed protein product [Phytomonas sp. Hart1]|nr:unnamed protein product [Phytomonas sp. Hart1]|eukprot:CCW69655.1 unnamed protein product [Phytomonas sp. isolate Hart1]
MVCVYRPVFFFIFVFAHNAIASAIPQFQSKECDFTHFINKRIHVCSENASSMLSRSEFNALANRFRSGSYAWMVKERINDLKGPITWLEGYHRLMHQDGSEVLVHLYVVYNESYSFPQFCLSAAAWENLSRVDECLPKVVFTNITTQGASAVLKSRRPLVSYHYVDELQMMVYAVHPCDSSGLMACGRLDGRQGDVLCVFLQVMAPFFFFTNPGVRPG